MIFGRDVGSSAGNVLIPLTSRDGVPHVPPGVPPCIWIPQFQLMYGNLAANTLVAHSRLASSPDAGTGLREGWTGRYVRSRAGRDVRSMT